MDFQAFFGKDITVHTEHGSEYRGVLKALSEAGVLRFDVGIDALFIKAESIYSLVEHGESKASVYSPDQ